MGAGKELMQVGWGEVGDYRFDIDGGVEERDMPACGFGLGESVASVGLVEEDLSLKV